MGLASRASLRTPGGLPASRVSPIRTPGPLGTGKMAHQSSVCRDSAAREWGSPRAWVPQAPPLVPSLSHLPPPSHLAACTAPRHPARGLLRGLARQVILGESQRDTPSRAGWPG